MNEPTIVAHHLLVGIVLRLPAERGGVEIGKILALTIPTADIQRRRDGHHGSEKISLLDPDRHRGQTTARIAVDDMGFPFGSNREIGQNKG